MNQTFIPIASRIAVFWQNSEEARGWLRSSPSETQFSRISDIISLGNLQRNRGKAAFQTKSMPGASWNLNGYSRHLHDMTRSLGNDLPAMQHAGVTAKVQHHW